MANIAIGSIVAEFDSVALVGFPDHSNVGDSAIWLGELAFLKSHSVGVKYSCSSESYRKENLDSHTDGDTPILIHGGGYFGDVWPTGLDFLLRVVTDFPDRQIIVMPQTIHFDSRTRLDEARHVINGHSSMMLCVRDRRSASTALQAFDHPIVLTPDSAMFLDLDIPTHGDGILYLAREDREAPAHDTVTPTTEIITTDWVDPPSPRMPTRLYLPALFRSKARLHAKIAASDSSAWQETAAAATRDSLASYRLRRGLRLLASAEIIITNRLHAHILSSLIGLPHVLLDNGYGKVRSYYEAWSTHLQLVHWASGPDEALTIARALAEQSVG